MTPRLLARLDLLAAGAERHWLDEIRRQQAGIENAARSRAVLAVYRARLSQSWSDGGVAPAALARRAALFSAAAFDADAQIDQFELRAGRQLQEAARQLAAVRARRNLLAEKARAAARQGAAAAEQRLERDRPPASRARTRF